MTDRAHYVLGCGALACALAIGGVVVAGVAALRSAPAGTAPRAPISGAPSAASGAGAEASASSSPPPAVTAEAAIPTPAPSASASGLPPAPSSPAPERGRLTVRSSVNAVVHVDGEATGTTETQLDLPCGSHRVRLAAPGDKDGSRGAWLGPAREVEVQCGGASEIAIEPADRDARVEIVTSRASQLAILLLARDDLRACYREASRKDRELSGALRLRVHVGVRGDVTQVVAEPSSMPASLVSCARLRLAGSQYGSLRSPEQFDVELRFTPIP